MAPIVLKSKYEILNLISENIISYFFLGKTHYSAIPVQIVKYKEEYLNSGLVRGLIQKCEQLMLIKDPHILMLIDYYYDGKNFYAIYEYPENYVTLETFLKKQSHWNIKTLWDFSTQILAGLMKMEYEGILYGNLNLSSILVSPDYKIKLTKIALPIEIMKTHWNNFQIIEDCIFYPPEFLKDQTYTTSSDIYSLGMLLYFLFSKEFPYDYVIKIEGLKKELIREAKPFKKIDARLPDRLKGVISQCLQHDPNARFQSFVGLIKTYKGKLEFEQISSMESKKIRTELENELKENKYKKKQSRLKKIYLGLGMVGFLLLLYGLYFSYLNSIPEREVPDVIGLSKYEANEILEEKKLSSMIAGARIHTSYEEGIVIETKPPAGRLVKQNRVIRLFVSKGTGPSVVPDLVGLSQEKVEGLLEKSGLNVRVIKELYSIQYSKGIVISQFPTPSTFSEPGEEIEIILSKGFPVELIINKSKNSFFKDKSNLRLIELSFFILDEWSSQDVDIFFHYDGKDEKIYSDLHQPGEAKTLEFELEYGGRVDVFFNNEKGFSKTIQD